MTNGINIAYILETESYIEERKNEMPKKVYEFIKQVCHDERKYLDLVKQWSQGKGVMKIPEPKGGFSIPTSQ
ncbi:hypothetical protein [Brevibacillus halotolerans]|uniref:hypothetical protein n=1 Tax=Brevibacillus halotolerans TaxID=1507437 RepID=UPI0015EF4500|nr:hypothetical protein [Brevibacillus halotolerans]MBA4532555.1 hypothetical protein [Brevibacillus halotolerans]